MLNTLQVDGLARISGYDKDHICRILSHRTASPHALLDELVLDGGRGKTMNGLVDRDREPPATHTLFSLFSFDIKKTETYHDVWCERCLLITESPKTPGHYRYLIWVLVYIPYTGLAVFSFAIFSCSCVYYDFEFLKFVFSTLQSRSCWQLTNSCLLRGLEGSLPWIDILSFLLPIWYIFEVFVGCWVRLICSRSLFPPCFVIVS